MFGLVQHHPLLLHTTLTYAADSFGDVEVVSHADGVETRLGYREVERRTRRLASSLGSVGIETGGMAGALAWTTHRYFELFHAVPGVGAVLHTANPRLSVGQLAATISLCGYETLFIDADTIPLAESILPGAPNLKRFVIMGEVPETSLPNVVAYDDLIAAGDDGFQWPEIDEQSASTLCFTSGTTGEPKGALYSHRGTLLSAMVEASPNVLNISCRDVAMAISPFFHCNGWGLPYLAPMTGAKLVLPGRDLTSANLQRLIAREGVTFTGGVPTIWIDMIRHCRENGLGLAPLERILSGGTAPSPELIRTLFDEFGVRTIHGWGMTETTHGSAFTAPLPDGEPPPSAGGYHQGRVIFGSRMRSDGDDDGPGRLRIQAHWAAREYFKRPDVELSTADGWMDTGDIGVVSDRNELRLTDRDKDAIKSGGEWIGSQALENAAAAVPGVASAAVIGAPHARWDERPILLVVREPGATVTEEAALAALAEAFPKWQLPDLVRFVESLPLTSVGKVDKRALREEWKDAFREEAS